MLICYQCTFRKEYGIEEGNICEKIGNHTGKTLEELPSKLRPLFVICPPTSKCNVSV